MKNQNHKKDSCFWPNEKRHADDTSKKDKSSLNEEEFNVTPKYRPFSFFSPSPLQGLRRRNLESEKEHGSTPKTVASDNRGHHKNGENLKTCLNITSGFKWSKILMPWKKGSSSRQVSLSSHNVTVNDDEDMIISSIDPEFRNALGNNSLVTTFTLSQLKKATNNFSRENLIGKGGYAEVFKGRLREDGKLVAVKRLNKGIEAKTNSNFLSELNVIAFLDHPNTAKLIGCCSSSGEHCLVFQLSPLGSLASLLHGPHKAKLNWRRRYKIALGIADGLLYLHDHCHRQIIHRDIKSENVLLSDNFVPQICDFGLAKWMPENNTQQLVTKFEGTFGYFAPEYLLHGIVNEKTDVYAFGILLLELITGRKALDYLQQSILLWAKPWLDANNLKELVDPSIGDDYDLAQMDRLVLTASLCVEHSPLLRPRMNQVVVLLRGDDCIVEFGNGSPRRYLARTPQRDEPPEQEIQQHHDDDDDDEIVEIE